MIEDDLWQAVRNRQKQISAIFGPNPANTLEGRMKKLHLTVRPVSLLTGLLTCGCCGGKFGIITPGRYACLNHHRRGTCDNGRSITREKIEARVLSGIKDKLVSSQVVAEAVKAYAEEMNRLNHGRRAQATIDRKNLAKVEKVTAGIISAIEDGMYQPSIRRAWMISNGRRRISPPACQKPRATFPTFIRTSPISTGCGWSV
ncbi:MAG: recombinase zinc beta ribbon domain-containing protein [Rhizobium rhizophilum]